MTVAALNLPQTRTMDLAEAAREMIDLIKDALPAAPSPGQDRVDISAYDAQLLLAGVGGLEKALARVRPVPPT